ncbi:MAG: CopG family ribbon-helix-helix protein [Chloroflexota bacterium]|nr:CopG family ribbon-helix-helix protein [Chloroflexota bacterium]
MTTTTGSSVVVNVRMSEEERGQLDDLAKATGRSRNYHIAQAIAAYLGEQRWQIAHIQEGIADADAGRLTPHAEVMAGLDQIIAEARARQNVRAS